MGNYVGWGALVIAVIMAALAFIVLWHESLNRRDDD